MISIYLNLFRIIPPWQPVILQIMIQEPTIRLIRPCHHNHSHNYSQVILIVFHNAAMICNVMPIIMIHPHKCARFPIRILQQNRQIETSPFSQVRLIAIHCPLVEGYHPRAQTPRSLQRSSHSFRRRAVPFSLPIII